MKTAVVVDDSMFMRSLVKKALIENNFEIIGEAANGETAIDMIIELNPDLVTLDNILPDMIGTDICKTLRGEDLKSKIIMISAVGQESIIQEASDNGACGYLVKPFTDEEVKNMLSKHGLI